MKKVMVIGGAGDMARVAEERLLDLSGGCRLTVADIDLEGAERAAGSLGSPGVEAVRVDIYDPEGLREAIGGYDLVMNCTGPYYRSGRPVLEACIDRGIDYIDLGDDEEAATALLELDEAAREKGITALMCCGIAPGLVNILAGSFAGDMDEVESVDLAWVTGSTPPEEGEKRGGASVIEHMIHCCMGECVTIEEGRRVKIPSFRRGHRLDFPPPLGSYTVFELGHAETATMPRFLPGVRRVRTMGALNPPYLNGIFRGIARQVERGGMEMREAVSFIMALDSGQTVRAVRPYMAVLGGVIGQLREREISWRDLRDFLRETMGRRPEGSLGGIMVTVEGVKDGRRLRRRASEAERQGGPDEGMDMDEVTGTPMAVMASMLLDGLIAGKGVLAPEACVDPGEFFLRLERAAPGLGEALILEEVEI